MLAISSRDLEIAPTGGLVMRSLSHGIFYQDLLWGVLSHSLFSRLIPPNQSVDPNRLFNLSLLSEIVNKMLIRYLFWAVLAELVPMFL